MELPSLPPDKLGHFFYGALMTAVTMCLWHTPMVSLIIVSIVAAAKEFSDWWANYNAAKQNLPPPHGVEFFDWLATVCGGLAVVLPWLLK